MVETLERQGSAVFAVTSIVAPKAMPIVNCVQSVVVKAVDWTVAIFLLKEICWVNPAARSMPNITMTLVAIVYYNYKWLLNKPAVLLLGLTHKLLSTLTLRHLSRGGTSWTALQVYLRVINRTSSLPCLKQQLRGFSTARSRNRSCSEEP